MFEKRIKKALKKEKRSTMFYCREKMVDRDALCPINVMSSNDILTNLGPISVDLIFSRPQRSKPQTLKDSTDNCIISPTFTL